MTSSNQRLQPLLLLGCLALLLQMPPPAQAAKKPKPTPTTSPQRKLCQRHGDNDWVFTRSLSTEDMLAYCEALDSGTVTMARLANIWRGVSTGGGGAGACYNPASWKFDPAEHRFLLRAIFRHHVDVDKDGRMSRREMASFLEPALRHRLLPGLLDAEYRRLLDAHFGRRRRPTEAEFVSAGVRMLRAEWPLLVRRTVPDLDGDNCVTQVEFARADCRRRVNEVDLYFRVADLDGNRAVTGPEFELFKASTEPEPGDEKGAGAFYAFFAQLYNMINTYKIDYYDNTSYANDQMVTFNEINLYICVHVI